MAALPTIPTTVQIGDVSTYLSGNDNAKGKLFSPKVNAPGSPVTIAIVTDALRWQNESFPNISEVNATGSITITDLGDDGDEIEVLVDDPIFGNISLGVYAKQNSDTTVTILASSIKTILNTNPYGYYASSLLGVINITSRVGLGSKMNIGNRLSAIITSSNMILINSTQNLLINSSDKFNI